MIIYILKNNFFRYFKNYLIFIAQKIKITFKPKKSDKRKINFITEKENNDTAHNFCKNPLSFLYFSNIKFHLKNHVEFIKDIIDNSINYYRVKNFTCLYCVPKVNVTCEVAF